MPAPAPFRSPFRMKFRDALLGLIWAVLLVSMAFVFILGSRTMMRNQLKEQIKSLNATATLLFDTEDLNVLRTENDVKLPAYQRVVRTLNEIRGKNPGIRFAYILRPTGDANLFSFVADADSLHPDVPYDMNGDGVLNEEDEQTPPGTPYDVASDPFITIGLSDPAVSDEPYTDQWGTYISGVAPIRDASGKTVAVLGLDFDYSRFNTLVLNSFSPIAIILLAIAGTAIAVFVSLSIANERTEAKRRLDEERNILLQLNAHQLGSPVTILQWSLETLKSIPESEKNLALAEQIGNLDDVADRLKKIMFSFHEAERVHAGTMQPEAKKSPINDIVQKAEKETSKHFLRRNQKLVVNMRTTSAVMAEAPLIVGVLSELLMNASDFSKDGDTVTLSVTADNQNVSVAVADTGCGIPANEVSHVFQSFTRASNAARQKPDGTGLGLYIAKGVIERAGGSIRITSTLGKGTTITFNLPVAA